MKSIIGIYAELYFQMSDQLDAWSDMYVLVNKLITLLTSNNLVYTVV